MIEVNGKYNNAKIFTDNVEQTAISQIIELCNEESFKNTKIRIMPDVHAGKGCTIGTTITLNGKVVPNLVGVDIGCFTSETKVQLCDGRQLSFLELIDEQKQGIEHYGYSIDKNSNIKISKLEYPRKTRTVEELIKITLDNNETIHCTLDHIFYTRDNEEIHAKDLQIGQSLMPLYIDISNNVKDKVFNPCKFELNEYNVVYNPNKQYYEFVHWLSDEYNERHNLLDNKELKGFVRHHKDFNKFNNNPNNIQRVNFKEHWKIHSNAIGELSKKGLCGFKVARQKNPELFSKMASQNMKKLHLNPDFARRRNERAVQNWKNYAKSEKGKLEAKKAGKRGSIFFSNKNSTDEMKMCQQIGKIKKIVRKCYEEFGVFNENNYELTRKTFYNYPKYDTALNTINKCGFNSFEDLLSDDIIRNKINHKIVNIEIIKNIKEDVYCLTVSEFGNFALASGVFVHNCGMFCVKLADKNIDFNKLDKIIREYIPSGQNIRLKEHIYNKYVKLNSLKCKSHINIDRAKKSIGTLGGGNHFIEVNKDSEGYLYLVVHSGSRYLGKQIAEFYQNKAIQYHKDQKDKKQEVIKQLKQQGREKEIQQTLLAMTVPKINESLAYLEGEDYSDYLNDMQIAQDYAVLNRKAIADTIIEKMQLTSVESFTTIHNYIDTNSEILRKGAIRANTNEKVLIPINMRDGSIIAIGKGNEDWNCSAPHGAGRILSRGKAKETICLDDFVETMKDVYTTSVCESTIDESPFAYKPMEEILNNITETVDVLTVIKPVYNYKAN